MLEILQLVRSQRVERDVELDLPRHVLNRGEAGLAHHALQHHAASDGHLQSERRQLFVGFGVVLRVKISRQRIAAKIVRIGVAVRPQLRELGAALRDDLVFINWRRCGRRIRVIGHPHYPRISLVKPLASGLQR